MPNQNESEADKAEQFEKKWGRQTPPPSNTNGRHQPDSSSSSENSSPAPLTEVINRLVNKAAALTSSRNEAATSRLRPPSPGNVTSEELDSLMDKIGKWSAPTSMGAEPDDQPDTFAAQDSPKSVEKKLDDRTELPPKSFFERVADTVDKFTGGIDESLGSEASISRLFSRADDHTTIVTQQDNLAQDLRQLSQLRRSVHQGATLVDAEPKIEIHRPASMGSETSSESSGITGFMKRLILGVKEDTSSSYEKNMTEEITQWIQNKLDTLPSEQGLLESGNKDSVELQPRPDSSSARHQILNSIDNLVTQLRLNDSEERMRIRSERLTARYKTTQPKKVVARQALSIVNDKHEFRFC